MGFNRRSVLLSGHGTGSLRRRWSRGSARLTAIVGDQPPLKHLQRPGLSCSGGSAAGHRGRAARWVSRPAVWRWQRRYAEAGMEGLMHDKFGPPGEACRWRAATVAAGAGADLCRASRSGPPAGPTGRGQGGYGLLVARRSTTDTGKTPACSRTRIRTLSALHRPRLH